MSNFYKIMSTNMLRINNNIILQTPLIIQDTLVLDYGQKISICRCWKSLKFPQCDGSHIEHNKQVNDNIGPFTIAARKDLK